MNKKIETTAQQRAKKSYEQRTENRVVPVRLGTDSRARLDRLAATYGGRRAAIEAALEALEVLDRVGRQSDAAGS
mgnify:CR=1 FL=1